MTAENVIQLLFVIAMSLIIGLMVGGKLSEADWTYNFKDRPYCENINFHGTVYKKCWKAMEVQP